jgi:hypothetical protein
VETSDNTISPRLSKYLQADSKKQMSRVTRGLFSHKSNKPYQSLFGVSLAGIKKREAILHKLPSAAQDEIPITLRMFTTLLSDEEGKSS